MAKKRMFSMDIVDSDAFTDMPLSSQALYFHLSMRADDDGFVNNPKKIQRMIGATDDDMKVLLGKRFLLPFESGIVVIKHWLINNNIRMDRYKETVYLEEKGLLKVKDNNAYTFGIPNGNQMATNGIPNDNQWLPQTRLDKTRLDKSSIDKTFSDDEEINNAFELFRSMRSKMDKPITEEAYGFLKENLDALSGGDKDKALRIIRQSVEKGWKGFYPLPEDKPTEKKTTKNKFNNFEGRKYTEQQILELERAWARG